VNCFNGERFLRQALDSVVSQTYENWEIIFWDNQSSDGSAEIAQAYKDERIKYFYAPKHTLLYEARNYAIENAKGDFLAFLDVDDWWLPNKLEVQMERFEDPEVVLVCSNYWVQHEPKNKRWLAFNRPLPEGYVLDSLLKHYFVALLTLMVRKSALQMPSAPFNPRYHIIGDFDLTIRVSAQGKVAAVNEPLASYRIHENNETARRRYMQVEEMIHWKAEMEEDSIVSRSPNFREYSTIILYHKAMAAVLEGKRNMAYQSFSDMPLGVRKFRILVAILLPSGLFSKIKN
jgi:glycosyltransferase involved in cell wall biosynthesis